jgi:hypothetical protein
MRSMATRHPNRGPNLITVVCFLATAFLAVSAWDEEAMAELDAHSKTAKERALRWAVEETGRRDLYAVNQHCAIPNRGERLQVQHADPRDVGAGFRCTYYSIARGAPTMTYVAFSRPIEGAAVGAAR